MDLNTSVIVPSSGCGDQPPTGIKSLSFDYITKGVSGTRIEPVPPCPPYYYGNFQADNVQINAALTVGTTLVVGTTANVGASLVVGTTINAGGNVTAPTFIGNLTGNVTGNVTGNLNGNVTGNLTGNVNGVASGNKTLGAFDIPHLKDKNKRIRHIIAEGPEPGIYIRGKLKDSNVIELPEYWDGLVDPETITVTLTQIGYSQDLIVDKIEWGKNIIIRSGLGANIDCFYEVWAARWVNPLDHEEKLHVVYEGNTPSDYPGDNKQFLVGGWDYDRRNTQW
jgi:hypothetical protein